MCCCKLCGPKLKIVLKWLFITLWSTQGFVWLCLHSSLRNVVLSCMASVPVLSDFIVMVCLPVFKGLQRDVSLPLVSNGCGHQRLMSCCNFTESDNMKNMEQAQCEPSHVLDRHEQIPCFWWIFLLLILSGNSVDASGGWQRLDRQTVQACMPMLTAKS